ncbi:5-formyltetrahydrofolate cyclo-ligase [Shimia sp.]|uniref:5-formyltetrahydrofolate cyclo-ligase n=1 Tax=Shimia sp. TaxID=1954381 RepID=UPI00329682F0
MTLADIKAQARKDAFARRKQAFASAGPGQSAHLSEVLAGYRGVAMAGYMPIRTEINPQAAMAECAAHGKVGVPVIQGAGLALKFSEWEPDAPLREGPFGAQVPIKDQFFEPEILIVPLVAFDLNGGRLGYGGGFYDRTLERLRARRATLAIGFAFEAQQAESLPLEITDQPLDMIVTESRIVEFAS